MHDSTFLRRTGLAAAALVMLCGGSSIALAAAPAATAATVDYDCDEAGESDELPGTVVAYGCAPIQGDPAEGPHITVPSNGWDWVCTSVQVRFAQVTGHGCRDVS